MKHIKIIVAVEDGPREYYGTAHINNDEVVASLFAGTSTDEALGRIVRELWYTKKFDEPVNITIDLPIE